MCAKVYVVLYLTDPGFSFGCSTNNFVNNSVNEPFPQNLQDAFTPKPEGLGSWNFERRFTLNVSCFTCHMYLNFTFFLLLFSKR